MTPREALKRYFGYDSFRPGQEEIVSALLAGRDALAIMPTGAGKSLCYQVPALLLPGLTLVISPLISLMQDQVKGLNAAGIHAAFINSSLTETQIARALDLAAEGSYKLVYVAPERLESPVFRSFAAGADISMVTVDEAHCISQWGQDFRPSYLRIKAFVDSLPSRPVMGAFTATATAHVREDIRTHLALQAPYEVTTSFDRPNLYFETRRALPSQKPKELLELALFALCYARFQEETRTYKRKVKELLPYFGAGLLDVLAALKIDYSRQSAVSCFYEEYFFQLKYEFWDREVSPERHKQWQAVKLLALGIQKKDP